jgi:prephenate dehydrogenase
MSSSPSPPLPVAIRQITIIGVGLMGGSLGLALKKHGFEGRIVGCDGVAVLEKARNMGAIDEGNSDAAAAVGGSQVVVLATPVGAILDLVQRLGSKLGDGVLLSDVGSTKAQIVRKAECVFGTGAIWRFLGCHPMAGKEQGGIEFADGILFQGATWFVTPLRKQDIGCGLMAEYLGWIRKIGAQVVAMEAEEHDRLCAWISHLPQMVSTALAASLVEEYEGEALEAGGRALREMTRIAGSPYSMWRDIALTNKGNVAEALAKLEQRLAHIRENLNTRELEAEFEQAHRLRLERKDRRWPMA